MYLPSPSGWGTVAGSVTAHSFGLVLIARVYTEERGSDAVEEWAEGRSRTTEREATRAERSMGNCSLSSRLPGAPDDVPGHQALDG